MRLLTIPLVFSLGLFVCVAYGAPAEDQASDATKQGQEASTNSTAATQSNSDASTAESWLTGYLDLGYQWQTGVGGNNNVYRSMVNLGSGPKILGAQFTIADPKHRLFDKIDVRSTSWGDEPYSTVHVNVKKERLYNFDANYQDISYFNYLPSFGNSNLGLGVYTSSDTFDLRRKLGSYEIELLPGNWLVPYFAYERPEDDGQGTTVNTVGRTRSAVPTTLRSLTNNFRAGIRIERSRFHITLEQGGTTYDENQDLFQGFTFTPSQALAIYRITGNSVYTHGSMTASITNWLNAYGQFLWSRPQTDAQYRQFTPATTPVVGGSDLYGTLLALSNSSASIPHTSGTAGLEFFPRSKFRVTTSWLTDRLDQSGNNFLAPGYESTQLRYHYSQFETDVYYDASHMLMLRGGYRKVWGDTTLVDLISPAAPVITPADLGRNIGIGGFVFRPLPKFSIRGNIEASNSNKLFTRTALDNYQRANLQAQYNVGSSLNFGVNYGITNNTNPAQDLLYQFRSQQTGVSATWYPNGGKHFGIVADYTRASVYSNILYAQPSGGSMLPSIYRDNEHIVTSLIETRFGNLAAGPVKLSFGGSVFLSSGSRPTNYYQPQGKFFVPITRNLAWISEWRYFGYGETFYSYEGFRTSVVSTGIRFSR